MTGVTRVGEPAVTRAVALTSLRCVALRRVRAAAARNPPRRSAPCRLIRTTPAGPPDIHTNVA